MAVVWADQLAGGSCSAGDGVGQRSKLDKRSAVYPKISVHRHSVTYMQVQYAEVHSKIGDVKHLALDKTDNTKEEIYRSKCPTSV